MIRRGRSTPFASTILAGALLAACGGSVTSTTGTGGGASSSTAGTGGSGTTTTSASTGGAPPACSTFNPTPPTSTPVSVRLVNKTTSPMYLGETTPGCAAPFGFTLEDAAAKALKPSRGDCEFTCGELQQSGCGCTAGCGAPVVTMVAPGAYFEVPWTGTVFTSENMPASCFMDPSCASPSNACLIEESAPTPPLTIKASAYTTAQGCTPGPCTPCMPGGLGTCTVIGGQTVGGTMLTGKVSWMGESKIDVDIQ